MPNVFPTDSRIEFIFCENIRQEAAGKLSLLGYVAGPHLNVTVLPSEGPNAIPSIVAAVAFVLNDGQGTFTDARVEMHAPDGTLLGYAGLDEVVKQPNAPNVTYINIPTLAVDQSGDYTAVLILDDAHRYTRQIRITHVGTP